MSNTAPLVPAIGATAARDARKAQLGERLASRILLLDGAMGTMLQRHRLTEADYRGELAVARSESSAIRDEVRADGRSALDEKRARANEEVAGVVQEANEELKLASDAISGDLRSSVETLSTTLASRPPTLTASSAAGRTNPIRTIRLLPNALASTHASPRR
jgi:hypothetical protein